MLIPDPGGAPGRYLLGSHPHDAHDSDAGPVSLCPCLQSRFRRMGHAVVFDRARLLQGRPDRNLDAARKAQVEEWAREQLSALPRLRHQRR